MKIVIKAENRAYPDNIGDYLWESIKPAAAQLDIELIRLPTEETGIIRNMARKEVEWINEGVQDLFIFFSNWVHGVESRKIAQEYDKINCPVLFWSREDPNHYGNFLSDARYADIIGTCCSDCIPKYEAEPNRKKQTQKSRWNGKDWHGLPEPRTSFHRLLDRKVISLPMAVAPEIFYPPDKPYADREWDIVFLGNRYITRKIRNDAEEAVVIAAAKWAVANGKKMGVWGHDGAPYGWWKVPEIYNTGIYQGRVDRLEAADIYRNAKVALSVSSNDYSPTMAPNRVVQIAACGTILIAYKSPATRWQTENHCFSSHSDLDTKQRLSEIFSFKSSMDYYISQANLAREHVLAHHTFRHRLETILEAMK